MKNLLFVLLAILFVACSNSPEVTSCEPVTVDEPVYETDYSGNVSFKGTKKVTGGWLHWDSNKECPNQNGYEFRVLKLSPHKILKSDRCDHCGYTWSLHDDK